MNPILGGLILGALIIIWGISIILKGMFGIRLPLFRVGIALMVIYFGIMLIQGLYSTEGQRNIAFAREIITATPQTEISPSYKIIFGQAIMDLSEAEIPASGHLNLTIDTAFGNTILILPKIDTPIIVSSSALFSSVMMPDGSIHSFGSYTYRNADALLQFRIHIHLNSIFSSVEIKNP